MNLLLLSRSERCERVKISVAGEMRGNVYVQGERLDPGELKIGVFYQKIEDRPYSFPLVSGVQIECGRSG